MKEAIININGEILTVDRAKISIFDRGYLYGDSLYEVARTYGGKYFALEEHLERLEASAQLAYMPLSQSRADFRAQMQRTLDSFRQGVSPQTEAYARLIVSRGVGRIGFGQECVTTPSQYTIIIQALEPPTAQQFEKGFHLKIVDRLRNDRRALDPAMKSGNYLNSLLAYLEAKADKKGGTPYDDALLCDAEGHVTEGTTFNVLYARRGIVATSPLDIGILDGITRRLVLEIAPTIGIPVREVRFPRERLYEADEVFLASSIREVFPVTRLDGKLIAQGKPGPLTRRLNQAFRERVATS